MKQKRLSEDPNLKLERRDSQTFKVVLDQYKRSTSDPADDDYDIEVGSFSVLGRNASLISDSIDRTSVLTDCPASPSKRVMAKRKITDFNAKFVKKDSWKKEHYCTVCKRDVDKTGVGRHHCRVCASAVCGFCSSRRINSRRVCDMCFYKKKKEDQEQQLERKLLLKDKIEAEKNSYVKDLKQEFVKEREKVNQLEIQIEKEAMMQGEALENQNKAKFTFLNTLTKAKEIHVRLASGIEINKSLIDEKESKLRSLHTKIASLKVEVAQKLDKHRELLGEFDRLIEKHTSLNELRGSVLTSSSRGSLLARNYSLLADENDGKFHIAAKPVQI